MTKVLLHGVAWDVLRSSEAFAESVLFVLVVLVVVVVTVVVAVVVVVVLLLLVVLDV